MKLKKYAVIIRVIAAGLFFALSLLVFWGLALSLSFLFKFQAESLVMRLAGLSAGAAIMLALLIGLTVIFGRFYCSFCCPFGIIQDVFILLSRRKGKVRKNLFLLRYLIAGIVAGLFAGGSNLGFLLLAPYSNAGRVFASFTLGGAVVLFLIIVLAVWKQRIFCTVFCPVGTMLGVFSRFGIFRLKISADCVHCGKCVTVCPAGCIDIKENTIDNARCIRCMACMSACPKECISFSPGKPEKIQSSERRRFLISAGSFIAGLTAGFIFAKSGLLKVGRKLKILPPGAGNPAVFANKCTACMLCVVNCPTDIIVPSPYGMGAVELDLEQGSCLYNCNRCGNVCPTGAITPLALPVKRRMKIAEAKFDPRNCIAFQDGEKCGRCAKVCPTGAITLRKNTTPRPIKKHLCIGCGACQQVCPALKKAMTVSPLEYQKVLSDTTEGEEN